MQIKEHKDKKYVSSSVKLIITYGSTKFFIGWKCWLEINKRDYKTPVSFSQSLS